MPTEGAGSEAKVVLVGSHWLDCKPGLQGVGLRVRAAGSGDRSC